MALGCDLDVKDAGQLPQVEIKNGRIPDIDVHGPDVDVHQKQQEIEVPTDVDVQTEKRTITVPDVDVTIPQEGDNQ
jgi:hypothetical protein